MKSVSPLRIAFGPPGVGREVEDEDRDRLGRVAGRLQCLQTHVSELDSGAVAERRELVLGLRPGAEVDARRLAVAQLQMPREKVRMQVRQQDVLDPAAELVRVRDVLAHVALGIDDRRDSSRLVRDEV